MSLVLLTGSVFPVKGEEETEVVTEEAPAEETAASFEIVFDEDEITMKTGEQKQVTFTLTPETEEKIVWISSDPGIISVDDNGVLYAETPGTAVITAALQEVYAELTVTVNEETDLFELRFEAKKIREDREKITAFVNQDRPEEAEYSTKLEQAALKRAEELAVSFLPEETAEGLYTGAGYEAEFRKELIFAGEPESTAEEILAGWKAEEDGVFADEKIRSFGFARIEAGGRSFAVLEMTGKNLAEEAETEAEPEEGDVYVVSLPADSSWIESIVPDTEIIRLETGGQYDLSDLRFHLVLEDKLNCVSSLEPLDIETEVTLGDEETAIYREGILTGKQEGITSLHVSAVFGARELSFEIPVICLDAVYEDEETDTETFEVTDAGEAVSISFSESDVVLYMGETYTPQLLIEPEDAACELMWSVGSQSVITRSKDGVITPVGEGHTGIYVLDRRSFLMASLHVTVRRGASKIVLSSESLRMKAGNTLFLRAEVLPENTTLKTVLFSSSDPDVVSVDERGLLSALSEGEAVITAVSEDGRAQKTCTVKVSEKTPAAAPSIMYINDKGRSLKAEGTAEAPENTRITILSGSEGQIFCAFNEEDVFENGKLYTGTIDNLFAEDETVTVKAYVRTDEKSDFLDSDVTEVTFVKKSSEYIDHGDVTVEELEKLGYEIPEGVWVSGTDKTFVYNGKKHTFSGLRVYDGNKLLKNKTDYTLSYSGNTNAGTGSLTVTGKGNYREKLTFPVVIEPADISGGTASDVSVKYKASGQYSTPAVTCGGVKLRAGRDFTVEGMPSEDENVPEGFTKELTITGTGNYTGTLHARLYVSGVSKPVAISGVTVAKIAPVPYVRGQELQVSDLRDTSGEELKLVYKKKELNPDQYTASLQKADKVGTAVLVFSGTGVPDENGRAFTGTKKVNFKITGTPLKNVIVCDETTSVYDGSRKEILLKDSEGNALKEGEDYTLSWNKAPVKAGSYTATVKSPHYSGTVKITYRILPVGSENAQMTVSDMYTKSQKPDVSVYCGTLKLKNGTDYTISYGKVTSSLSQKVTVKLKGNYTGTLTETVNLSPRSLSDLVMTVKDSAANKNPGKNYSSVKITDIDGKTLTAGSDYVKPAAGSSAYTYVTDTYVKNNGKWVWRSQDDTVKKTDVIPAGTKLRVTVKAKGKGYSGTASQTYMVTESGLTLSGARVSVKKTYIYTGKTIIPEKKDIVVTLKDGTELPSWCYEIVSVSNAVQPSSKATVTLRGINSRGYGGQVSGTFTIKRRSLVTAADETPDCGSNAYYDGIACVCSPGFKEEDGMCVFNEPEPAQDPVCGEDAYYNGKACVCWPGYTGDGYSCTLKEPEETPDPGEVITKQLPDLQRYLAVFDGMDPGQIESKLREVYTEAGFDPALIFFVRTVSEKDHKGIKNIRPVPDGSMYDVTYPILVDIWIPQEQ